MDKEEAEQKEIVIYWWNLGTKTLDFRGSYKDFLKRQNIKVSIICKLDKSIKGYRFNIPCGSSITRFDNFDGDYTASATLAIKLSLVYLGDKAKFIDGYGREHKINWR